MNFELSDEQKMLQDTLRRMLSDGERTVWPLLCEQGIFAALFNAEHGGLGGSGYDLAIVFEELGRAGVIDPVIDSAVIGGRLLAQLAAESHRDLLEQVVAGSVQLAFAHGERTSRYDLNRVETFSDQHVLNGRKSVVVNATAAARVLVSARVAGDTTDSSGIAVYLLPLESSGISIYDYEMTGGGRAADLLFDNVQLSAVDCLSDDAFTAIENSYAAATVSQCAETLGAMETAISMTGEYLNTRQQFGQVLSTFQALSHRFADMLIELEQARSAVMLAAGHLDAPADERNRAISAAKNLMGRCGQLIAEEAIQLHGGIGMTDEYQLGHFAKRIIMADHRFGDVDYHLERFMAMSAT